MKRLYFGDNLQVLRESVNSESVDLIYLDPPFNSNADYNVIFGGRKTGDTPPQAQITAFEDTWHWSEESARTLQALYEVNGDLAELLDLLVRRLGHNDLSAYLVMMAIRLVELHRVLKPTGSLYLHCDPTASHYLKIILDSIFSSINYRCHITWKRSDTHNDAKNQYSAVSDHILFYVKSSKSTFNAQYTEHSEKTLREWYLYLDLPDGSFRKMTKEEIQAQNIPEGARRFNTGDMTSPNPRPNLMYDYKGYPYPPKGWRYSLETMKKLDNEDKLLFPKSPTGRIMLKRYLDEQKGSVVGDNWTDISQLRATDAERLGYPTQKPLALLERILKASSNEGDMILDPFCGCGTALHAAQKLNRNWIGIDITHLAISLIEIRLESAFPQVQFEVFGTPKDFASAQNLAKRDKYQFQWWACSLVKVPPYQGKKKGADGGIDGLRYITDLDGDKRELKRKIIVSVKGGENVSVAMVRDLIGTMQTNKADLGFFITLAPPTKAMTTEATKAGFYRAANGKDYPKVQIFAIEDLLSGAKKPEYLDLSLGDLTFKRAEKESVIVSQAELF